MTWTGVIGRSLRSGRCGDKSYATKRKEKNLPRLTLLIAITTSIPETTRPNNNKKETL
jgi:hypothetical protein